MFGSVSGPGRNREWEEWEDWEERGDWEDWEDWEERGDKLYTRFDAFLLQKL